MSNNSNSEQKSSIFISHRHEDKEIASVLRRTIRSWTAGHSFEIYQSSDPKYSLKIGECLSDELKKALEICRLFLLIYTIPDENWSYCMFESGLVSNLKSTKTRVVVFQFGEKAPAPLDNIIRVKYNKLGIKTFTEQFHRTVNFFPHLNNPFDENIDDEILEEKTNNLWESLKTVRPRPPTNTPRWLSLTLKLSLKSDELKTVRSAVSDNEALKLIKDTIKNKCFILQDQNTDTASRFGYAHFPTGLTLWGLFERWKDDLVRWNHQNGKNFQPLDWYTELNKEIVRVLRDRPAEEVHIPIKSVQKRDWTWYLPAINRVYSREEDYQWEFIMELYRIPSDGKFIKISAPTGEPI